MRYIISDFVDWINSHRAKTRERRKDKEVLNLLKEEENSIYNKDHLKSKMIDMEEEIHLRDLWRKIILLWTLLGNSLLMASTYLASTGYVTSISQHFNTLLYASIASVALSLIFTYRQHKRIRRSKKRLRKLHIVLRRNTEKDYPDHDKSPAGALPFQQQYREDLPDLITQYREEANKYRKTHNRFQSVIIIGSVTTSAITTASVSYEQVRWFAVAVSAIVGLAAGFTGYFKYRERSFNLQQTADAIEREYESVQLRVGKYRNQNEEEAFSLFAATVESIRDEQNKRQQQLDQPVEVRRDNS
ncbi:DUF4231 domain-containing protein [Actinoalloteichus caeruleus]|uniref:DUF4231 domain-containing protein n=1 Tax=Actinoalloteichus cyanogriseus TaxID=2893586 RepID=UPI003AAF2329